MDLEQAAAASRLQQQQWALQEERRRLEQQQMRCEEGPCRGREGKGGRGAKEWESLWPHQIHTSTHVLVPEPYFP